jgi:predicted AlkP superfamily phosphohydrolase/phosphomutase
MVSEDTGLRKSNFRKKVFLVGLDGATFNLIIPWVEEGILPNFSRILKEGCYGQLESTLPPLTTPAWASFMTGKNPGKHGIFDFAERKAGSYDIEWVTSRSRNGRSLWKIVNSHGGQVVAINIPNNYPLEKVDGCMVAWMDAPGTKAGYTYPPSLVDEIEKTIGGYIITILDWKENEDPEVFRSNLHRMIDKRAELSFYLMENKPWDLFAVLFSATDIAQHCFWSYMDPLHPSYNMTDAAKFGETIKEVYVHIDRVLGDFESRLGKDTLLMLMSDHGFGPLRYVINLNRWLEQQGWLRFKATTEASAHGKIPTTLTPVLTSMIHKTLSVLKYPRVFVGLLWEHLHQPEEQGAPWNCGGGSRIRRVERCYFFSPA